MSVRVFSGTRFSLWGLVLARTYPTQAEACATGYGSKPNTATLFDVGANTLPSAIIGVTNLFPPPKWSRPPDAWLLL